MKRKTRVGLVTSGGDCQGLNAAIRGVGKRLFQYVDNIEIFGMYDGYRGLIENDYKFMEPKDFSGIIAQGGTILGTSRQPFIPGKAIVDKEGKDVMPAMLDTYNRLNLDCLVVLGGNGTQKSAKLLHDAGMNVITLPKTIDNDIYGTDETFGFQSAADIATNVIDYIHTTALAHSRIFLVEVMGRDAGWLTPHRRHRRRRRRDPDPRDPLRHREGGGDHRAAEKRRVGPSPSWRWRRAPSPRTTRSSPRRSAAAGRRQTPTPPISYRIADELEKITGQEARVTVPRPLPERRPRLPLRPGPGNPLRHRRRPDDHGAEVRLHGGHPGRGTSSTCLWRRPPAGPSSCRWTTP